MLSGWLWLTGYGPSNFEMLLILVAVSALAGAGYGARRRRWRDRALRSQSELAELQCQQEQFQNDLAAAQRQNERVEGELGEAQHLGEQLRDELAIAQHQITQLQADLTAAQRQKELDAASHRSELDEIRRSHDPVRIKELQNQYTQEIAHELKGLEFVIDQIRQTVVGLRNDQHDLRLSLNDAGAAAYNMMQFTKMVLWRESPDRLKPTWEMLRTRQVIEDVLRLKIRKAEFLDVRLLVEYGSLGPILTDRLLLGRVCDLIIDNAITHSRGREVDITQRLENETGRRMFIEVRDHGDGIPEEDQERIFERNARGKKLAEGSGLGLYLARIWARLLGGDVELMWSKPGDGSLFRIILPYGEPGEPPSSGKETEPTPPRAGRFNPNQQTGRCVSTGRSAGRRDPMRAKTRIASVILLICSLVLLTGCRQVFPPAFTKTRRITIQSTEPHHEGRYVVAQNADDNWVLRQRSERSDCAWFTLYELDRDDADNLIVALETCHKRFVTVPRGDTTRPDTRSETRRDRMAWQEKSPGDCAKFTLEAQSDGSYAFRTCGGRYLTAGNASGGWETPVDWAVIVENPIVQEWEKFKLPLSP